MEEYNKRIESMENRLERIEQDIRRIADHLSPLSPAQQAIRDFREWKEKILPVSSYNKIEPPKDDSRGDLPEDIFICIIPSNSKDLLVKLQEKGKQKRYLVEQHFWNDNVFEMDYYSIPGKNGYLRGVAHPHRNLSREEEILVHPNGVVFLHISRWNMHPVEKKQEKTPECSYQFHPAVFLEDQGILKPRLMKILNFFSTEQVLEKPKDFLVTFLFTRMIWGVDGKSRVIVDYESLINEWRYYSGNHPDVEIERSMNIDDLDVKINEIKEELLAWFPFSRSPF
jgi:hypothetical protein